MSHICTIIGCFPSLSACNFWNAIFAIHACTCFAGWAPSQQTCSKSFWGVIHYIYFILYFLLNWNKNIWFENAYTNSKAGHVWQSGASEPRAVPWSAGGGGGSRELVNDTRRVLSALRRGQVVVGRVDVEGGCCGGKRWTGEGVRLLLLSMYRLYHRLPSQSSVSEAEFRVYWGRTTFPLQFRCRSETIWWKGF